MNYVLEYQKRKMDYFYTVFWGLMLVICAGILFLPYKHGDVAYFLVFKLTLLINSVSVFSYFRLHFMICFGKKAYVSIDDEHLYKYQGGVWSVVKVPLRNITELFETDNYIRIQYIDQNQVKIKKKFLSEHDYVTLKNIITRSE